MASRMTVSLPRGPDLHCCAELGVDRIVVDAQLREFHMANRFPNKATFVDLTATEDGGDCAWRRTVPKLVDWSKFDEQTAASSLGLGRVSVADSTAEFIA